MKFIYPKTEGKRKPVKAEKTELVEGIIVAAGDAAAEMAVSCVLSVD